MSEEIKPKKRKRLTVDDYVNGILNQDRAMIARAITLVESNSPKHFDMAQQLLKQIMPYTGNSIRIGFTGVPGAGKSTLIEAFGTMLCEQGHRVAVLAVDPSSAISRGSILGDKTRMKNLSRHPNAYVRPSPSGGTLGGVARKSRETILICEAAGYDVIIVETVGVGQNEITVRSMVDFFLVVMLTGGGDELQGMKKGIMEIADAIFINKADGDNLQKALATKAEFNRFLHFLKPASPGWKTKAYTVSALTGDGVPNIWEVVKEYEQKMKESGYFEENRANQLSLWMERLIEDELKMSFYKHPAVKETLPKMKEKVASGDIPLAQAVQDLMQMYRNEKRL